MANEINNGTFTFNQEELKDISKIVKEKVYENPLITEIHEVQSGIKYDTQIVFSTKKGLMGKSITDCAPPTTNGISLSEKKWTPSLIGFRLTHCHADVDTQDKLLYQWKKTNPDFYNVIEGSQSAVGAFLAGAVLDAMPEDILVKAWFGDKTANTYTNSGNITNGFDLALINSVDGLFKQIFTQISTPTVSIAKNNGTTFATQELASGESVAVFKALYNKADSRLRSNLNATFFVTRSLYDGLLNDIEDKNFSNGFTEILENGKPTLTYRGIKVLMLDFWDRYIKTLHDNGTKLFRPHRAVLTVKENIPLGTQDVESLTKLDAWFERKDQSNYIDAVYNLDAKLLETYMCAVAY
jgi:hypothetical protein